MNLTFNANLAENYTSNSQRARVLTEQWVRDFAYCPSCGTTPMHKYENNKPVGDFACLKCREDFELKSKQKNIGSKISDGAYGTMIERLTSATNPNFFLLSYELATLEVSNFLVIPKHFFVPEIIEKRTALSATARRAGWVGCNIVLTQIPETGRIFFVRNKEIVPKEKVRDSWNRTLFLREEKELSAKGWLLDVMRSIEKLQKQEFALDEIYQFESELSRLHPDNHHIKDKIRQQLQVLRDKGYLEFSGRALYRVR